MSAEVRQVGDRLLVLMMTLDDQGRFLALQLSDMKIDAASK